MQLQDPNCGPLDKNFFKRNKAVSKSPQYIDLREVTGRHKLEPGAYCIVPTTFYPGEEGDFLLRVYTEKPIPECRYWTSVIYCLELWAWDLRLFI